MTRRPLKSPGPAENRLLAALPKPEHDRVVARTREVTLDFGDVVYRPNGPVRHVLLPRTGVLSMVVIMADGGTVEVATVGNEGFAGLPLLLGTDRSPAQVYCQVPPCVARRMDADAFREEAGREGSFRGLLARYAQAAFAQSNQSTACNRLHSVEERCARWLLMTHDRVGADEFPLTHEILAQMLGVRRAGVTVAAGVLQRAGLIEYRRGRLRVLDRAGLEDAACECYGVVRGEFDRLLG